MAFSSSFPSTPQLGLREQDQYMPIANVIRIMRKILPPHAKISDDAKETIQECVSEYISFITAEANDRCQREQRKTVTAEDVLWAMGKLGFDDYVGPLSLFLYRYRQTEGEPAAIRRTVAAASANYGMMNSMPPPPPHPQQLPAASPSYGSGFPPHVAGGMLAASGMGGFYRDDGSGAAAAGFGPYPYGHLKRNRH